ncbi:MAG: 50S ribosomal protein L25/general stress protein Ctc [Gammaproteobacteria bacterium]|nr:50S ribosomal protein L25/general stress protein Ctc [Gammaproteobacteria bacterium]MBL6998602.1 50S ribosomal protein L25/general stress protein Ctc [Gammaproteobacteria bacterium]
MSAKIEIHAEPRSDFGKGASRRLRKTEMVPAIVYGGKEEPVSVSLLHNEFIHQLNNEAIYTQVLSLELGKKKVDVILRDLQRHPYKHRILHADFQRVDNEHALHITVPIHFLNEDICHGVKQDGGQINHLISEVEIIAFPKDLPEFLQLDLANLALGEVLYLSDIKCPEGVEILELTHGEEHDAGVVTVNVTKAMSDDDAEATDEVEADAEAAGAKEADEE